MESVDYPPDVRSLKTNKCDGDVIPTSDLITPADLRAMLASYQDVLARARASRSTMRRASGPARSSRSNSGACSSTSTAPCSRCPRASRAPGQARGVSATSIAFRTRTRGLRSPSVALASRPGAARASSDPGRGGVAERLEDALAARLEASLAHDGCRGACRRAHARSSAFARNSRFCSTPPREPSVCSRAASGPCLKTTCVRPMGVGVRVISMGTS